MIFSTINQIKNDILNMRLFKFVGMLFTISFVFVVYLLLRTPANTGEGAYGIKKYGPTKMDNMEIAKYMAEIQDTRPSKCLEESYHAVHPSVSIIVHFNEDQFYDAKLTLHSVIENTAENLYKEIVLLDDGSQSDKLRQHAAEYVKQKKFLKVKAYRSEVPGGESSSKFKATEIASGDILVFLSSRTVVNKGWLPPLLHAVSENRNLIATPHVDNFLSNFRFYENQHNHVNILSLTLGTYYYERDDVKQEDTSHITNPVLRGDAFAISKHFLQQLGGFDQDIKGGGEHLELSLRAWMCGGKIKIVPCSRVVTHDALEPVVVTNPSSIRRITELWLGYFKNVVYNQARISKQMSDSEEMYLRSRRNFINNNQQEPCKTFEWYHDNVAKMLVLPNGMPRHFGTIGDKTGYCIRVSENIDGDLNLVQCRPHTYDPLKIMEMTNKGMLMMEDKCMQVFDDGRVALDSCSGRAEAVWDMHLNGKVFLKMDKEFCLTHAMERNRQNELIHFLTMDKCQKHREQIWSFTYY